jgi:hypothetical protein
VAGASAPADASVVVVAVSVPTGAVAQVGTVSPVTAAESAVVVVEVSVASGAVAPVPAVSAVPEVSVVVAEVSGVSTGAAGDATSLGSDDVVVVVEVDGAGSSA